MSQFFPDVGDPAGVTAKYAPQLRALVSAAEKLDNPRPGVREASDLLKCVIAEADGQQECGKRFDPSASNS